MKRKMFNSVGRKIFGFAWPLICIRFKVVLLKFTRCYTGKRHIERLLEKYVDYDNGFYVELGANDGVTQSNTFHFEVKRNWSGILIEPTPNNFLILTQTRGGKANSFFCKACVSRDYKEQFVKINYADVMSVAEGLVSDLDGIDEHLASANHLFSEGQLPFSFGAEAATLTQLLDAAGSPGVIDFLSLDVEGAELEVLMGVDFLRYNFKYILIEARDLDAVSSHLGAHGYRLVETLSVHDYLFEWDGSRGN